MIWHLVLWLMMIATGALCWEIFVTESLRRRLREHDATARLVSTDVRRRGGRSSLWL